MVTAEQLRTRPVVLRLRLGGNRQKLSWLVNEAFEYSKLEHFSGRDCVDFMLQDPTVVKTEEDRKYAKTIKDFINGSETKGNYSIGTIDTGTMVCSVERLTGKIHVDHREKPAINYLINQKDSKSDKKIWFQELRIIEPKYLGAEYRLHPYKG